MEDTRDLVVALDAKNRATGSQIAKILKRTNVHREDLTITYNPVSVARSQGRVPAALVLDLLSASFSRVADLFRSTCMIGSSTNSLTAAATQW